MSNSTIYVYSKAGKRMRKMNMAVYPKNWNDIREEVKRRAGYVCEGIPEHPDCDNVQYGADSKTWKVVFLQAAHLDHDTSNNVFSNLRALCPTCHLTYDRDHHKQQKLKNQEKVIIESGQLSF